MQVHRKIVVLSYRSLNCNDRYLCLMLLTAFCCPLMIPNITPRCFP